MTPPLSTEQAMQLAQAPHGRRIAYGSDAYHFGELRLPGGTGLFPLAIVVHGGCWSAEYGLGYMGNLCAALTQAGVATWTIEYRRVGDAGGGWPGTFQDVAVAADHVRTLAREYPVDLDRTIAVGHSAGGHLGLWLAGRHKLPRESELFTESPLKLRGVVSLAGIPDLAEAGRERICGDMAHDLIGGTPEQLPERYRVASPAEMLPLGTAMVMVHGTADMLVPSRISADFAMRAEKAGDRVHFISIVGAGHFELINPASAAWSEVRNAVLSLTK